MVEFQERIKKIEEDNSKLDVEINNLLFLKEINDTGVVAYKPKEKQSPNQVVPSGQPNPPTQSAQ